MSEISKRILRLLEERKMSYGELSELTGISKSALQRYATGQTEKIPLDRLEKIAAALNYPASSLMGWIDADTPANFGDGATEDDIKFALFGGESEITDEMYEEVRQFAAFVKNREAEKKKEQK